MSPDPIPLLLSVAVAAPLFRSFDYLPLADTAPADYRRGQRVQVSFGRRSVVGIIVDVKEHVTSEHSLKRISKRLDPTPLFSPQDLAWLAWAARYYCHPIGETLATAMPAWLRKPQAYTPSTVSRWHCVETDATLSKQAKRQQALLSLLQSRPEGMWQETIISMGFSRQQLRGLLDKGFVREEHVDPLSANTKPTAEPQNLSLNQEQLDAVDALVSGLGQFNVSLLQGVTGSGKTEVYIEAAKQVLMRGEQVLILVPEINLTPQTLARFQQRLTVPVACLHSQLGEKEKADIRYLANQGNAPIIIGTRSAIFTPFSRLGLIIIDEEHDASYKQQDGLRYSARDLGIKRAQMRNIPIVLGSATPSLESFANATQGRYQHIQLKTRAGDAQLPQLSTLDVRSAPLTDGIHSALVEAIRDTLNRGHQVILFQNRRGYSPTLMCYDCGWLAPCTQCDVRLTVHRQPAHLHCHHCDYQHPFPAACPQCQSAQLHAVGSGTERLEYALEQRFADTPVYRMDRDAISTQGKLHAVLDKINSGEPCIIIGTQMIAKGHDFKHVTLVGVVDADGLFFSADFRAIERGAQLLLQVAGRAGRSARNGKVIIQTRQPEHPLFADIARGDYTRIAEQELEIRETCDLPPYSKMISVRAEAREADQAEQILRDIGQQLHAACEQDLHCLIAGPVAASIHRKANRYRFYLHLYFDDAADKQRVSDWLATVLAESRASSARVSVDIDPLETL